MLHLPGFLPRVAAACTTLHAGGGAYTHTGAQLSVGSNGDYRQPEKPRL